MEAEVEGEEDEEEEDEDGYGLSDEAELSDEDLPKPEDYMRRLHQQPRKVAVEEEFDPEAEEARLRALYGRSSGAGAGGSEGLGMTRTAVLLPKATDPKLWLVKCRPGKERDAVTLLCRGLLELDKQGQVVPPIFSAVSRDSLKGYVYVEAFKPGDISVAIQRLRIGHLIFASQWTRPSLVPMGEMADVLTTKAASTDRRTESSSLAEPGSWVRVKRGKYAGDLAQVLESPEELSATSLVRIRILPRLTYRNQSGGRPPARPFDPQEAAKYGSVTKARGYWQYGQELYNKEGFLIKEVKLSSLQTSSVNPRPEELERFGSSEQDDNFSKKDTFTQVSFIKGDRVIVKEGDLKGVEGIVDSSNNGEWISVRLEHPDLTSSSAEQIISFKPGQLGKNFEIGDSVRVLHGSHQGQSGMVVAKEEGKLTILTTSTANQQQLTINSNDAIINDHNANPTMITSQQSEMNSFDLNDLVQSLDGSVYGLVVKIFPEEGQLTILDQAGTDRLISCNDLRRIDTRSMGSIGGGGDEVFKAGDRVQIDSAQGQATRPATILQAYRTMAWVKTVDTGEILTRRFTAIHRLAPFGHGAPSFSSSKSHSAGGGGSGRHLLGKSVTIAGGVHKGYVGIVKDVYDSTVRVELHTNSKIVEVPRDRVVLVGVSTPSDRMDRGSGVPSGKTPAWGTSKTPAWGSSKTPAWGSSKTPAWGSGKTPAWSASEGKTPAWNAASGKTPAWNASSGKTPAWNAASGKTPAWSASGDGKTPAWNSGGGGRTPSWNAPTAKTPTWNTGKTPVWSNTNTSATTAAAPGGWNAAPTPAWSNNQATSSGTASSDLPIWAQEGILVRLKSSDSGAADPPRSIRSAAPGKIILSDDQSYRPTDLLPVPPSKKDRVRVLTAGPGEPATGTVIGMDGPDAVVRLDETAAFRIVPVHNLGRLANAE